MKKSVLIPKSYCQLFKLWARQSPRSSCIWQQRSSNQQYTNGVHGTSTLHPSSSRSYCTNILSEDHDHDRQPISPTLSQERDRLTNIAKRFRTDSNDVLKIDGNDAGLYFKVSRDNYLKYYQYGHPVRFNNQVTTFKECGIMVRKPAIEILDMINHVDLELPPVRFFLYGRHGSGKSLSLCHVVHKLSTEGFITVHFPDIKHKTRYRHLKPRQLVQMDDGSIENTEEAVEWLELFKLQNGGRLEGITTEVAVSFTARENYDADSPIMDIIEFGIDRAPFATQCIGIVLKELRRAASDKRIKVAVALDGVNVFWKQLPFKGKDVPAQQYTMLRHFMEMLKPTWANGIVVGTICAELAATDKSELAARKVDPSPLNLLGKEGFKFLDPFIPVEVTSYTKEEAINCLDYYIDNHWITLPHGRTRQGKEKLMALSARHPLELMNICCSW